MVSGLLRTGIGKRPGVAVHPRRRPAATTGSSTDRRSGPASRSTPAGASCSPAPGAGNHDGITAFFVDMDTPGITVRPLRTMHGVDEFCEVYFDDVVIPADRMLGKPGDGWQLAMDLLPYERSTCFWQRIAYLYARFDRLIAETSRRTEPDDAALGAAYLALHTLRCRSRSTQHRLADGARWARRPRSTRCCLPPPSSGCTTPRAICCPAPIELDEQYVAHRVSCTRVRRRSTAAPPRSSETSLRAGCSTSGRSDRGSALSLPTIWTCSPRRCARR